MASLNLDLDYFDHPKTVALVDLLGADADVIPIRLWCYCGRFHTATGCVPRGTAGVMLERRIGWRGPAGECIKALVATGFLEEVDGGFKVHDWLEHSGHLAAYRERAKVAANARWEKARPPPDATSNATSIALSNAPALLIASKHCVTKPANGEHVSTNPGYHPEKTKAWKAVLAAFARDVTNAHGVGGANSAIIGLMVDGVTEAQLLAAVANAGKWWDRQGTDRRYRESAAKFFGQGGWEKFRDGVPEVETKTKGSLDDLKRKAREARENARRRMG